MPQAQPPAHPPANPAPVPARRYRLSGTVKSIDAAAARLVIRHGAIPGLMGAMTMSYDAGQHEDIRQVAPGDEIESDVAGEVVQIFVENGSPVEYGEPLFGIRTGRKK